LTVGIGSHSLDLQRRFATEKGIFAHSPSRRPEPSAVKTPLQIRLRVRVLEDGRRRTEVGQLKPVGRVGQIRRSLNGVMSRAARELGITRMALRYRIKKYGL